MACFKLKILELGRKVYIDDNIQNTEKNFLAG